MMVRSGDSNYGNQVPLLESFISNFCSVLTRRALVQVRTEVPQPSLDVITAPVVRAGDQKAVRKVTVITAVRFRMAGQTGQAWIYVR